MEERFAVVELMGHRVRCGRVSKVEEFGALLRVEPLKEDGTYSSPEDYSTGAIYGIRWMTKEAALDYVKPYTPPARQLPSSKSGNCSEYMNYSEDLEHGMCPRCRDDAQPEQCSTCKEECDDLTPVQDWDGGEETLWLCENCLKDSGAKKIDDSDPGF